VRLDDGSAVTVRLDGMLRFSPGERVRLLGGRLLPDVARSTIPQSRNTRARQSGSGNKDIPQP
jgi:hypothetical protein